MDAFTRALTSALIALMVRNSTGKLPQVDTTNLVNHETSAVSLQDDSQHNFEESLTNNSLRFSFSEIDSDWIMKNASDNVTDLSLYYCPFVTDLSGLSTVFPNLQTISISNCAGVSDLSFIYYMEALRGVDITGSAAVTQQLVCQLEKNGVRHNFTDQDIKNSNKVNEILKHVVSDDMSDVEKIEAICAHLANNYQFSTDFTKNANTDSLTMMLENGRGGCADFAYLSSILFTEANIKSFDEFNSKYIWNTFTLDGQEYYFKTDDVPSSPFIGMVLANSGGAKLSYVSKGDTKRLDNNGFNGKPVPIPEQIVPEVITGQNTNTSASERNKEFSSAIPYIAIGIGIFIGSLVRSAAARKDEEKKDNYKSKSHKK